MQTGDVTDMSRSLVEWAFPNAVITNIRLSRNSNGSRQSLAFGMSPFPFLVYPADRSSTMSIILLLDCAFSFFQNYPCRLSHIEVECDFPCAESLFALEHPYSDRNFQASRGITILEAFHNLFEDDPKDTMPSTPDSSASGSMANLTVLDMFILIHGTSSHR